MNSIKPDFSGKGLRIGMVQSRFNEAIVGQMAAACEKALLAHGVVAGDIEHVTVPGALEIPLALQAFALTERFDALIALGAVIRGETYHFEIVANESARGVLDVSLETGLPIANAILTTDTEEQALSRIEEKSAEAARVAIEMAHLVQRVRRTA
jgi:6,7-dimethyl-8-ribityllumazine synthase